ncbi:hypothetical protein CR513_38185, partial [Mucuna pruriens]
MGIETNECFLVQFIINSLPVEFGQFQVMLIHEEGRLKKVKDNFIHLMTHDEYNWSNRLSLNLMRLTMVANVNPSMPKTYDSRKFMKLAKDELTNKKFDWSQPIHGYAIEMSNLASKMKSMGMGASDTFLVQFILKSFPIELGQF